MSVPGNLDTFVRPPSSAGTRDVLTRADIVRFFRNNGKIIVLPIALAVGSALLYAALASPIFTARSELLIDPKLPPAIHDSGGDGNVMFDAQQLESQIAVLRSDGVARGVVAKLNLANDPEFSGQNTASFISRFLGLSPPVLVSEDVRKANAAAAVRNGLDLRRIGASYAIEVAFPSKNAKTAAQIVNATTEAYLEDLIKARGDAARQGSIWLEQRVEELRAQMNDAARRVQEFRASQDYRIHRRSDGPLGGESRLPDKSSDAAVTLEELESTAATYRKIYENFYQAFTEAVQRQSYPVSNARVISTATPPTSKSHPKTLLVLTLASVLGSILGIVIALIRNSMDRPIADAGTIRHELGLPCLGQIPKVRQIGDSSIRAHAARFVGRLTREHGRVKLPRRLQSRIQKLLTKYEPALRHSTTAHLLLHSVDVPMTPFSRAIRRVKTGLAIEGKTKPYRLIGVTSAFAGEGKTTIASNLAAQYASPSHRTLLIDADIYRATLSRHLVPEAKAGLLEFVSGKVALKDVIVASVVAGLDILPIANTVADDKKRHDILSSDAIREFISSLSKDYATVIFDLPPLKIAADGYVLATLFDGTVVVAESDVTPLSAIDEILYTLREARAPVLGLVLNRISNNTIVEAKSYSASNY